MAGGATPRQRMINLMYLVLTALLALQVSSTIIDKFIFLNRSLEDALVAASDASTNALETLKKKVGKEGSDEGRTAVKRAEELKKKTAEMITYIDNIKRELIKESGGMLDGKIKNPSEEEKVAIYLVGSGNKKGKGYELGDRLNKFVDDLYKEYGDLGFDKKSNNFPLLAVGNANNPLYKSDPIQRGKDFPNASFAQTPVVAAQALLTQKQNEIVRYEQEILKKLGAGDLTADLKFDEVKVAATAESNTVAAGTDYIATMFLSASSSKADVRMSANGSALRVKDGEGEVRIPASGKGEQSWTGTITLKLLGKSKDTTFTITKKYNVVLPALLVTSATKFPLYQNCPNALETAVPALGASYNPSFSVNNGRAIPGARTGDVVIIPSTVGTCILSVRSDGKAVGNQEFRVNKVPPPSIVLTTANGNEVNTDNPIPNVNTLIVVPKPDETFFNTLPKEASYRIVSGEITQFRNGRQVKAQPFSGGTLNMTTFDAKPGDAFSIKVTSVQRAGTVGVESVVPLNTRLAFFSR